MYENFWYLTNIGGGALLASFISYSLFKNKRMLYYSDMKYHLKKSGFTLAEVLITLGIIGVVAALTMPTIIANYQKEKLISNLKRTYSILGQALVQSQYENGEIKNWDYGTSYTPQSVSVFAKRYVLPYLKYQEDGIKSNRYYIRLNDGSGFMILFDGMSTQGEPPHVIYFVITYSGKNLTRAMTDPSRNYSRTDFIFTIRPSDNKLSFFKWSPTIDNSSYGCNKNIDKNRRYNCGALIYEDSWQIKEYYPW